MPDSKEREKKIMNVINICRESQMGVLLLDEHKIRKMDNEADKKNADDFLKFVSEFSRLPEVKKVSFLKIQQEKIPKADLNIIPLPKEIDFKELRKTTQWLDASCIYTLDSGEENALA